MLATSMAQMARFKSFHIELFLEMISVQSSTFQAGINNKKRNKCQEQ